MSDEPELGPAEFDAVLGVGLGVSSALVAWVASPGLEPLVPPSFRFGLPWSAAAGAFVLVFLAALGRGSLLPRDREPSRAELWLFGGAWVLALLGGGLLALSLMAGLLRADF